MRLVIRLSIFGGLILLMTLLLTPRLQSLMQLNVDNLAAIHDLVAPNSHRSIWDVCFSSLPNGRLAGNSLKPIPGSTVPTEHTLDGRKQLWKYLAQPDLLPLQDIENNQSDSLDSKFSKLVAGCSAWQRQRTQEAIDYFAQLPELARGLARWGDAEELAGHLDVAENAWRIASQIDHVTADIHFGYASFLRRHGGSLSDTLRELTEATRLAPKNWIYRTALGEVYQEQGHLLQAIQVYSEALSLTPDQGPIYFQRGRAFYAAGELSEACADIQRAIALDVTQNDVYTQTLCLACTPSELCKPR